MILSVRFFGSHHFLLVISFADWKEILSKTSVLAGDQMFKDTCKACFSIKQKNRPAILGTSLTSLEPEPSIRLYMARGNDTNMHINLLADVHIFYTKYSGENLMNLFLVMNWIISVFVY